MANSKIMASRPMQSVSEYQADITGYNSVNNQFTCPFDGYIVAAVWNGDTQTIWFNGNNLSTELNSTNLTFMMYAARGTKWWVNGNGNNRYARFAALINEQPYRQEYMATSTLKHNIADGLKNWTSYTTLLNGWTGNIELCICGKLCVIGGM